ncbi:MAG: hypothetical protein FWD47_15600 [Treponema sp.]|nr:hypothetical protein [Treponema sp.]
MKTKHFFYGLIVLAVLLTTCKKETDYRDKWVGDWDFVVEREWWIMYTDEGKDTTYYSGKISYGNSSGDLYIKHSETDTLLIDVDESGKLYFSDGGGHDYADGQFEGNNKMILFYHDGGLGGWMAFNISGIKKEGDKK